MNGVPNQRARVLELAITPLSRGMIAVLLGISVGTVKLHLANLYRQTGCRNRLELICKFLGERK